jgi:hypothetical protein
MPRVGDVVSLSVWRVPKPASARTSRSMRAGCTARTISWMRGFSPPGPCAPVVAGDCWACAPAAASASSAADVIVGRRSTVVLPDGRMGRRGVRRPRCTFRER